MLSELISELDVRGVNFVKVVDVSMLPANQNQGYGIALLIGIALSQGYISRLSKENITDNFEFSQKEQMADELAEWIADFITTKGYKAYAQSERVLLADGFYNETTKRSLLPHKTIALLAGLGWIGKNNLLVTPEYGSAVCISTVLTNAPLPAENKQVIMPECGKCTVCKDACQVEALHGSIWEIGIDRDLMVDIKRCNCCLKCLVYCPWTQRYMVRGD